ncbi:DUF4249 domain-containing protein [Dyadobacter sp. CY323]|uniref:DUF4249 domain-containing protein n=1 Tax=Dyadobacter sp. CY323 TaxID=2907302 RepID=UPI001F164D8F|nr:DUF4249 domain-containing protein [Dyadobacter sp. CY323]MCE6990798.1 DUF4249 domain-containing protein [Dyadobacter sp. CY323]
MTKFAYIFLLFSAITFAACESLITDVDPSKLPPTESKLVVQSFISPQSARINVVVTESVPVFGSTSATGGVIRNAVVKISDGAKEAIVPYDTASQLYSLDKALFPIVAAKTYYLTVTDGRRSVSSSCKVPARQVIAKSYVIDTSTIERELDGDAALTVKMTWDDIKIDTNFYRVHAAVDLEYSIPEGTSAETFKEKRVRNRFNFNWDETIGRNDFQSDSNLDGASFSSPIGRSRLPQPVTFDYGNGNKFTVQPRSKIISVTMEVYNTDGNYFRYHRSLEMRGSSDNPFIEPSLIFTNIKGGLGCFAAYNSGQLVYRPQ